MPERTMHSCLLIFAMFIAGCATGSRDDYKLRTDIADLHMVNMPIVDARKLLAGRKFICAKDTAQYEGSFLRTVECTRAVQGIGCRDDEGVTLDYKADTGLVERVTTGRKNGCN